MPDHGLQPEIHQLYQGLRLFHLVSISVRWRCPARFTGAAPLNGDLHGVPAASKPLSPWN